MGFSVASAQRWPMCLPSHSLLGRTSHMVLTYLQGRLGNEHFLGEQWVSLLQEKKVWLKPVLKLQVESQLPSLVQKMNSSAAMEIAFHSSTSVMMLMTVGTSLMKQVAVSTHLFHTPAWRLWLNPMEAWKNGKQMRAIVCGWAQWYCANIDLGYFTLSCNDPVTYVALYLLRNTEMSQWCEIKEIGRHLLSLRDWVEIWTLVYLNTERILFPVYLLAR